MDKYWKLIDFCDKREVIDCESEEECISLIHDIIHRTVPSEEWGDLEITSSKIRHDAHEFVCYTAISDRYIRFFFYFYDAFEEELDDEYDHNRKLNATACKLSERSEKDKRIAILENGIKEHKSTIEFLKKEIRKLENDRNRLNNIINKTFGSGATIYSHYLCLNAKDGEFTDCILIPEREYKQLKTLPTDKQYIKNLEHLLEESNRENDELGNALTQRDIMLEKIRDIVYPF